MNRWVECKKWCSKLVCLCVYLSLAFFSVSVSVSVSLSICLWLSFSIYLSMCLCPSVSLSVCLSFCLSLSVSFSPLSLYVSISLSLCLSLCLWLCLLLFQFSFSFSVSFSFSFLYFVPLHLRYSSVINSRGDFLAPLEGDFVPFLDPPKGNLCCLPHPPRRISSFFPVPLYLLQLHHKVVWNQHTLICFSVGAFRKFHLSVSYSIKFLYREYMFVYIRHSARKGLICVSPILNANLFIPIL